MPSGSAQADIQPIFYRALARSEKRLRPIINGLVTDRNTKLCCRGFVLALYMYFKVLQPIKLILNIPDIISELFPVCNVEILQVYTTVNKI